MRKVILTLSIVAIIAFTVIVYFLRTRSGIDSIYLVPDNALLIIETENPQKAWDKIIHSNAWNHFSRNDFFNDLYEDIQWFDSLANSNKFLLKLIGEKPLIVSQHPTGGKKYDYLYVIEAGKTANYTNPAKLIATGLGKNYEISTREYKGYQVLDIFDRIEREYCYMSFVKGKVLFSWTSKLIEQSIDASEKIALGTEPQFLKVRAQVVNQGLFSVCILHNNLQQFLKGLSTEARESFNSSTNGALYSGLAFDLDNDGVLKIEGYTGFEEDLQPSVSETFTGGSMKVASAEVIPDRIASMVKVNFDDLGSYIEKSMKLAGEKEYKSYLSNVSMVEKMLKINLKENLYSWVDDEIVLLQTQPSNLGRANEFAAVIRANDSTDANENLHLIYKQIKKNSPVKVKSVTYKGYDIDYIAFPGIIKMLFGKMLKKIEKPYITQIGENIIVSNHPQTNKNIIDDYLAGKTLDNSTAYSDFSSGFSGSTSAWMYTEPIVLYQNLKSLVKPEIWQKIQKNKEYITCFDQAGLQVNTSGQMLHYLFKTQYKTRIEEWNMPSYNLSEALSMFDYTEPEVQEEPVTAIEKDTIPEISVSDFDAKKYEEFYDDGTLKLTVGLKSGLKNGDLKVYYPSGEIKITGRFKNDEPVGKWKYYTEEGDLKKTDEY